MWQIIEDYSLFRRKKCNDFSETRCIFCDHALYDIRKQQGTARVFHGDSPFFTNFSPGAPRGLLGSGEGQENLKQVTVQDQAEVTAAELRVALGNRQT